MTDDASGSNSPIACVDLGLRNGTLPCCYEEDSPNNPVCETAFLQTDIHKSLLQLGCPGGDCLAQCRDPRLLYTTLLADNFTGHGDAPIARYRACTNLPAISRSISRGTLDRTLAESAEGYIPSNVPEDILQTITASVTDCLSSTCRNSRDPNFCYNDYCSPTRLLINSSTPNVQEINNCLYRLCHSEHRALPYADQDVVGIGVYSSYILQCVFALVLWFGLMLSGFFRHRKGKPARSSKEFPGKHQDNWIELLLLEFHKAQCYFSGTLMIACFSEGIYETDMLLTFMLLPLATNGILPITFAYFLLFFYHKSNLVITLLTIIVWALSSLVCWTLYSHMIQISTKIDQYDVYSQFMYKLSAYPACGGYSALAACPIDRAADWINSQPLRDAASKLRVLPLLIWLFSTAVLLILVINHLLRWRTERVALERAVAAGVSDKVEEFQEERTENRTSPTWHKVLFWLTTAGYLAGFGLQMSLLEIATTLDMMNTWGWSFGQIVAVTIWVPPLLEYIFHGINKNIHRMLGVEPSRNKREADRSAKRNGLKPHATV
ncbi:hypothetical protein M501DRAFT_1014191 [Patellaria atrata CBS 101060]|uniref:Uncharacterized protein n=1 Tax=Patellaria atrata CBS 101060 TaxID=1346257 RepID=A0A9P4SF45_9PEZI|nr:hypothetical protein M501DRAFT_1014191 [Patellaria atrata CBS 101060]